MGATHAAAYSSIEGVRLSAIADQNRELGEKLASHFSAKYYCCIEDLIASNECDAVDICLPTHLHETAFINAVEHGLHVLCEKPIVTTVDAIDRIISATQKAGVITMVAQVIRFWPEYLVVRNTLLDGSLGKPRIAKATRLISPPAWSNWFSKPNLSGGALFDLHIHDLDYVYSLFGMPHSVCATGVQGPDGGWDHVLTTLDYGDKKAHLEGSNIMPISFPFQMSFRLSCEKGCIDFRFETETQVDKRDQANTRLVIYKNGKEPEFPSKPIDDGYLAEIKYFVDCLKQGCQPEIATLEEAREVIKIVLAAKHSLETGSIVTM